MAGMSWTGRPGPGQKMLLRSGHPVLPLAPTHRPQRPGLPAASERREGRAWGGGARGVGLAQLVWLVLASWQRKALGTGEDVAGRSWGGPEDAGGGQLLCSQVRPSRPQTPMANSPAPEASLGSVCPAPGTRSLTPHPQPSALDGGVWVPSPSSLSPGVREPKA